VLVEDDGIGIETSQSNKQYTTENHIGLSVMQERSKRINGEINYENDDGEGTLIQLNFDVPVHTKEPARVTNLH